MISLANPIVARPAKVKLVVLDEPADNFRIVLLFIIPILRGDPIPTTQTEAHSYMEKLTDKDLQRLLQEIERGVHDKILIYPERVLTLDQFLAVQEAFSKVV